MKSLIIWQKCHKAKDCIIKVLCIEKKKYPLCYEGKNQPSRTIRSFIPITSQGFGSPINVSKMSHSTL